MSQNRNVQQSTDSSPKNVVVFGEAGVGKSSLINLIAGRAIAGASSDARGCTFQHHKYDLHFDHGQYALWDTVGLDEGTGGTVSAEAAEANLKQLLRALINANGVHLLVFCTRASRLRNSLLANYKLFYSSVCRTKVPIAVVVNNLENCEGEMEDWWTTNEAEFARLKMHFDGHACVTTLVPNADDPVLIRQRCEESRHTVLSMIATTCARGYHGVEQESWLSAALADAKATLKPARKGTFRPTLTIATYNVTERPLDTIASSRDNPPFEGCLMDIGGTSLAVYPIHDEQLLSGSRFRKQITSRGADLLIFSAPIGTDAEECQQKITTFYDSYGGDIRPFLIVVTGAETDEVAFGWWEGLNVHSGTIRAIVRALPSLEGAQARAVVAVAEVQKVIQTRSLEPVEVTPSGCFPCLRGGKRTQKLPSGSAIGFLQENPLTKAGVWAPLNA